MLMNLGLAENLGLGLGRLRIAGLTPRGPHGYRMHNFALHCCGRTGVDWRIAGTGACGDLLSR